VLLWLLASPKKNTISFQTISVAKQNKALHDKIHLDILFHIIVSALPLDFYQGNSLFMISDNSFLYEYNITNGTVNEYPLLKMLTKNILKQDKPDFESITHFQDTLYVFGSNW
jgi:hypothetical protein